MAHNLIAQIIPILKKNRSKIIVKKEMQDTKRYVMKYKNLLSASFNSVPFLRGNPSLTINSAHFKKKEGCVISMNVCIALFRQRGSVYKQLYSLLPLLLSQRRGFQISPLWSIHLGGLLEDTHTHLTGSDVKYSWLCIQKQEGISPYLSADRYEDIFVLCFVLYFVLFNCSIVIHGAHVPLFI